MLSRPSLPAWLAIVALGALLLAGVFRLLALRFAAGDVYPPGSSLRPDPLGSRALYDSLARLPNVVVRRHLDPDPGSLPEGHDTTLTLLGLHASMLDHVAKADMEALERFVRGGGRLVIALTDGGGPSLEDTLEKPAAEDRRRKESNRRPRTRTRGATVGLAEHWGFSTAVHPLDRDELDRRRPETVVRAPAAPAGLPEGLSWHGPQVFRAADEAWTPVYLRGGEPVVMERRLGAGRIVLVADGYPFRNEALWRERVTPLVWWALGGGGRTVVFDETHLGIARQSGVATLARRYGLHWVPLALLAVVALIVWRSAAPLVPRAASADPVTPTGRDSVEGFQNLLRRGVPRDGLLAACLAEWRRTCAAGHPDFAPRLAAMEARLASTSRGPRASRELVAAWRDLAGLAAGRAASPSSAPTPPP